MLTVDFERFSIEPGFRVLDVGCGSGRHTGAVARMPGVHALGLDRDLTVLREARERLRLSRELGETEGAGEILAGDITRLPFPDDSFDLVVCSEVLEHVPDDRAAVRELARVLRPGCDMAVSVPRFGPERICWALSRAYAASKGGHVRIYRARQLIRLLESQGLTPRGHHHAHGLHTPYWWLKCLVGPDRDDSGPVRLYHRLLVWDLMKKPPLTRAVERALNPLLGKSLVLYLHKPVRDAHKPADPPTDERTRS